MARRGAQGAEGCLTWGQLCGTGDRRAAPPAGSGPGKDVVSESHADDVLAQDVE